MFAFFYGILEMNGTKVGRRGNDNHVYVAVDNLLVRIQPDKALIGGDVDILFVFQFLSQTVYPILKRVAQCHNRYAIRCREEVHRCATAAPSTTDDAGF